MTVIYDTYYPAIAAEEIILANVDFGVIVTGKEYTPDVTDTFETVTDVIEVFDDVLVEKDIVTLTMSEIIEKVTQQVNEELMDKAYGFVVFDTPTKKLCFYENFDKIWLGQDTE